MILQYRKYPDLMLKETTIRRLKNSYQDYIQAQASISFNTGRSEAMVQELPNKKVGRPLMINKCNIT